MDKENQKRKDFFNDWMELASEFSVNAAFLMEQYSLSATEAEQIINGNKKNNEIYN